LHHLRSLNVRHYGIVETNRLKNVASGLPAVGYYHLHKKFHPNRQILSKVAPPQKFKRPQFGVIDIAFHVITTVQNFIQIHQLVQKLQPPQKFKPPPLLIG
jgi:hypothetical protein